MAHIAFIGLGNMGLPMARNLAAAGHVVAVFDRSASALAAAEAAGMASAATIAAAAAEAEVVITMLPAGPQVRSVYEEAHGVLAAAPSSALLIDCSTIDVATSRAVAAAAAARGNAMLDAPVSGGVGAAAAGTLTFMVGGEAEALERAKPYLQAMGKTIIYVGGPGNGQAAKICNNMMLGIQMISVAEAMALAEKLGLDHRKLFDISSQASGQCWSLTTYCPVPGPVPTSPANHGYRPGFTAAMMLKDLKLAQEAAASVGAATPLGAEAHQLYTLFARDGNEGLDFSAIFRMMSGTSS